MQAKCLHEFTQKITLEKMHQLASTTPMEETEKVKYTEFNKST